MTHKEMLAFGEKAERAAVNAFAKLVKERRKTGESLIFWKDGKVAKVPASQIPDSALRYRPRKNKLYDT